MKNRTSINLALLTGMLLSVIAPSNLAYAEGKHKQKRKFDHCADYVVIGMGGAGCVVTRRLTDDFCTSVIGLESGFNTTDQAPIRDLNRDSALLTEFFPEYFWQGVAKRDPAVNNRQFAWTNGRTFGGGSAINGLQYVRGTTDVWQVYEDTLGNGWTVDVIAHILKGLG